MNDEIFPLVPVRFAHRGKRTPIIDALLDSGSDKILVPSIIADELGLSTKELPKPIKTAGGDRKGFETSCDFELGRGGRTIEYRNLTINVADSPDIPVLIGRDPIFKDFKIVFEESKERITLTQVDR